MKKIIAILSLTMLSSCVYTTHPRNVHSRHNISQHSPIESQDHHWAYIEGHQQLGVWVSPRWVRRTGSHPHAHQAGWHKIQGRWNGHGRTRVWAQPHWERGVHCRHRR